MIRIMFTAICCLCIFSNSVFAESINFCGDKSCERLTKEIKEKEPSHVNDSGFFDDFPDPIGSIRTKFKEFLIFSDKEKSDKQLEELEKSPNIKWTNKCSLKPDWCE